MGLHAHRPFRPRGKEAAAAASFPLRGGVACRSLQATLKLRPGLVSIYTQNVTSGEDTWTVTLSLICVSSWPAVWTPLNKILHVIHDIHLSLWHPRITANRWFRRGQRYFECNNCRHRYYDIQNISRIWIQLLYPNYPKDTMSSTWLYNNLS